MCTTGHITKTTGRVLLKVQKSSRMLQDSQRPLARATAASCCGSCFALRTMEPPCRGAMGTISLTFYTIFARGIFFGMRLRLGGACMRGATWAALYQDRYSIVAIFPWPLHCILVQKK